MSGAWKGRFLVRCPLVLVGVQGWQKYLMRSFPSESFCFFKPRTAPTPSKESGSPIVAAQIIEQRQLSGSRYSPVGYPKKRERQMRSKAALNAHLMTDSSSRARRTGMNMSSTALRIPTPSSCSRTGSQEKRPSLFRPRPITASTSQRSMVKRRSAGASFSVVISVWKPRRKTYNLISRNCS